MVTPKRIQRKRSKGWRMPGGVVYVGRPTEFGNPFKVGFIEGLGWGASTDYGFWKAPIKAAAAAKAVDLYRAWIAAPEQWSIRNKATALRGYDLACFCPIDQPCHADVLLELANADPDGNSAEDAV